MAHPGKFEGCAEQSIGDRLHTMTLDGMHDEELGDVQDFGWYALILAGDSWPTPEQFAGAYWGTR